MGRKPKLLDRDDAIRRILFRGYNQELAGQTKLKHYKETKDSMVQCKICDKTNCKLHRHRIIEGKEYTDENTIIVCVSCHNLIHKYLKELKDVKNKYPMAVFLATDEVKNRSKNNG